MISNTIGTIDREVTPGQQRLGVTPACWLSLAASPTFALMALLTRVQSGGMSDMLCSVAQHASPLTGMASMYLLMSAFHVTPWLRLFSRRCEM